MDVGGGGGGDPPNPISKTTTVMITCVVTGTIIVLLIVWFVKYYYFKAASSTTAAGSSVLSSSSPPSESNSTFFDGREVTLSSIPIFVYTLPRGEQGRLECCVCLEEFEERERGRTLPTCSHSFHAGCIETWFRSHATCPMCRSVVVPEPQHEPNDPQV